METTSWRFAGTVKLKADKVLQRYARNLRAPALNCAQYERCIYELPTS